LLNPRTTSSPSTITRVAIDDNAGPNRRHRNIDPHTFAGNVTFKKDERKEATAFPHIYDR